MGPSRHGPELQLAVPLRLARALHILPLSPLVALDVLELALLVTDRIDLLAGGGAMRRPLCLGCHCRFLFRVVGPAVSPTHCRRRGRPSASSTSCSCGLVVACPLVASEGTDHAVESRCERRVL